MSNTPIMGHAAFYPAAQGPSNVEKLSPFTALAEAQKRLSALERENNQLRAQLAEAESSLSSIRAECLRLSRENIELRRGAPLERVISPNDSRVTDYTD